MRTEQEIKTAAAATQSTDELLRLLLEVMLDLREVFTAAPETEDTPAPVVAPPPVNPASLVFIEDLPLTNRTKNALHNFNYRTLHHLMQKSAKELSCVRNLGALGVNEIGAVLEELGFKLPGYPLNHR